MDHRGDPRLEVEDVEVVIVGCGLAGLCAAREFRRHGVNSVVLLDAHDRIGGRVHSVRQGGAGQASRVAVRPASDCDAGDAAAAVEAVSGEVERPVELGATFVHGKDARANVIAALALECGALGDAAPRATAASKRWRPALYARVDGGSVPAGGVRAALAEFDRLIDACDEFARGSPPPPLPRAGATVADVVLPAWRNAFGAAPRDAREAQRRVAPPGSPQQQQKKKMNKKQQKQQQQQQQLTRAEAWDLLAWRTRLEACISGGATLASLDLQAFGEYVELPGGDAAVRVGYDRIVRHLARGTPAACMRLSTAARGIRWGVPRQRAEVRCAGGATLRARVVVVTVPLGVLQRSVGAGGAGGAGGAAEVPREECAVDFEPALPAAKADAARRLGFGGVEKVVLEFDAGEALGDLRSVNCVWHADPAGNGDGDDDDAWRDPELSRLEARLPAWCRGICSYYRDPVTNERWTCWVGGAAAQQLGSSSDEEVRRGVVATMRAFAGVDVPEPRRVLRSSWCAHPAFRGSYTYVARGSSGDDIDELARPLRWAGAAEGGGDGACTLHFAGEHTHRQFYSTAHGAVLSGEREARRALRDTLGVPLLPRLWSPTTTETARQLRSEQDE